MCRNFCPRRYKRDSRKIRAAEGKENYWEEKEDNRIEKQQRVGTGRRKKEKPRN